MTTQRCAETLLVVPITPGVYSQCGVLLAFSLEGLTMGRVPFFARFSI